MRVEGNLRGLKDWKGKGTPKQTSKDEIGRDLRVFRNNNTKRHANSLGDLEKYAPHATVEESDDISEWIAFAKSPLHHYQNRHHQHFNY